MPSEALKGRYPEGSNIVIIYTRSSFHPPYTHFYSATICLHSSKREMLSNRIESFEVQGTRSLTKMLKISNTEERNIATNASLGSSVEKMCGDGGLGG